MLRNPTPLGGGQEWVKDCTFQIYLTSVHGSAQLIRQKETRWIC